MYSQQKALQNSLLSFFIGKNLDNVVNEAMKDFVRSTKGINIRKSQAAKVLAQTKGQFQEQAQSIIREIIGRQRARLGRLDLIVEAGRPKTQAAIDLIPKNFRTIINGNNKVKNY